MAAYTFGELEDLWRQAGGSAKKAPVMAAIALAESRGRPRARHVNANGTIDRGLWQVNSSHGYGSASFSPLQNAREAVAIERSQGLRAWSTYTTGAYKAHLEQGVKGRSGDFGVFSPGHFAGVDQGVDFSGAGVIPALDAITITNVRRVSIIEGGTYPLVAFRFDSGPYKGRFGYVMENFQPQVKPGQRLKRGQPIGHAIGAYPYIETGFASGPEGNPLAPLGANPHAPTSAGKAMEAYIQERLGGPLTAAKPTAGPRGGAPGSGSGAAHGIGDPLGIGASVGAAAHTIASPFESIASTGESISGFLGHLVDPHFWLRALELVGGIVLVLLGLYLLARNVGLAQPVEDVAGVLPVGRAAKLGDKAAAEMQFSPGRAAAGKRKAVRHELPGDQPSSRRRELVARGRSRPSDDVPF